MTPKAFKHWRKELNLSQKDAATLLGLKHRIVQYYEKGERDGKPIQIPKSVRLACWALTNQVEDFDGFSATRRPRAVPLKEPSSSAEAAAP